MKNLSLFAVGIGAMLLPMLPISPVQAQASRTWVSGVGDDVNPCSRTAPCKTWAGAISKTAAGGEIDALDPGGFGAVTLNKSITLDGGGGPMVSVLNALVNGIQINTAGVTVTIRNISINGIGTGVNGISFTAGNELNVENCVIFNQAQNGINFAPTNTGARLFVSDTKIYDNGLNGILVKPPVSGNQTATANLTRVILSKNGGAGLAVQDGGLTTSHFTTYTGNATGVSATSAGAVRARAHLDGDMVSGNGNGILTSGSNLATIDLSGVGIYGNQTNGINVAGGGIVYTFSNNHVDNNGGTNATNGTLAPQ